VNALGERIAALIAAQGPISIADFMALAGGQYYATRDPFGQEGDFVTAPEISQVFGEMLGLWCVQVWHDQGRPKRARLVELGPGRGTLMADALRAARLAPEFLDGLDIVLVEASPALRAIQEETLKDLGVRWTDRFDSQLGDRPLFLQRDLSAFQDLDHGQAAAAVHGRMRAVGNAVDEMLVLNRERLGERDER